MFETLQERLSRTLQDLRGHGKIRESNIQDALEEIRKSLLEADVQYRVVQSFVDSVRDKSVGEEVVSQVHPGQQFTKIIFDELVAILGGKETELPRSKGNPLVFMICGLQGSGKTTTLAKIAKYLRDKMGEKPYLVPADTYRPAAVDQLRQLGQENGIPVFETEEKNPLAIVRDAMKKVNGREVACSVVLVDTAGRLAIDEAMMKELEEMRSFLSPERVLYVLDAMAGQDAVRSAQTFSERIAFDGVIVSKMDGDARGGAALSVVWSTGKPIYFLGTGEKVDALEKLYPDRLASRILGMGDIVSFVEKAQEAVDHQEALKLAKKISKNQFTIDDFAEQMKAIQKMGSFDQILDMIPGGNKIKKSVPMGMPEEEFKKIDAMIKSMTPRERQNYQVIDGSRRKRIADGSGTRVQDVNRFLKQFIQARKMMSQMGKMGARGMFQRGMPKFF